MTSVEKQLSRLFAEMEAEQAPFTMAEIVGDPHVDDWEPDSSSTPRRGWMLVAAMFVVLAVGWAAVLLETGDNEQAPVGPVDTPTVPSTAPTSTVPLEGDPVDHRSYFSVDDALQFSDPVRIDDRPASRGEIAQLLAGGEDLEGTDIDVRPLLFFVTDADDQATRNEMQRLFPPTCADYDIMGGFVGLDGGGGYPAGLLGAFQTIADGGMRTPDWIYVDWYDDDLTYDEATALLDESVLAWIIARGYVFGRGYSGSKIAVALSPDPTAPWNQAVIDHPFIEPTIGGSDLVEAVCNTFNSMEPL